MYDYRDILWQSEARTLEFSQNCFIAIKLSLRVRRQLYNTKVYILGILIYIYRYVTDYRVYSWCIRFIRLRVQRLCPICGPRGVSTKSLFSGECVVYWLLLLLLQASLDSYNIIVVVVILHLRETCRQITHGYRVYGSAAAAEDDLWSSNGIIIQHSVDLTV